MRLIVVFLILLFATFSYSQEVSKDYLMGTFRPSQDRRFVNISGFTLRQETFASFKEMQRSAAKNGIRLRIISATRTFNDQKRIWENKWNAKTPVSTDTGEFLPKPNSRSDNLTREQRALRILEFTAMPSASRHHWGTDFDLNNVNSSYWETAKGRKEFAWLSANASTFGFCQVYSGDRQNGYKEEKWHWSFLPLAQQFTSEYAKRITNADIANMDFIGADVAVKLNFIDNFVLGINKDCN
jgi:zinc D-Ala-D-Ala carboxypeptidase